MSVYIEMKSDEQILDITEGYQIVLIIGCTKCANISTAYSMGYPLSARQFNRGVTSWKPFAINEEMKRISKLLKDAGRSVAYETDIPCMLTDEKDEYLYVGMTDISAILCISCVAGKVGIEKIVGESIPVLLASKTTGIIQHHIDITTDYLFLNKEKSTIIAFDRNLDEKVDLSTYWSFMSATKD